MSNDNQAIFFYTNPHEAQPLVFIAWAILAAENVLP
jgi:hypothetical protein